MKKIELIGLGIATLIFVTVGSAGAALVTNGSFEGFIGDTNDHNGAVADGWIITDGTPDTFDADTDFYDYEWGASTNGGDFVHALVSFPFGNLWLETLEQEITGLIIDQQYQLSFEQSISRGSRTVVGGFWQISFGVESQNSDSLALPGLLDDFTGWQSQTMFFTATSETQILSITGRNATNDGQRTDLGIDGLSLNTVGEGPTPTPEPATMLLLGTGLVGLVGSRIRKKKQK